MLSKKGALLALLFTLMLGGCSSVEKTYKPLYQVKPERQAIEGGL